MLVGPVQDSCCIFQAVTRLALEAACTWVADPGGESEKLLSMRCSVSFSPWPWKALGGCVLESSDGLGRPAVGDSSAGASPPRPNRPTYNHQQPVSGCPVRSADNGVPSGPLLLTKTTHGRVHMFTACSAAWKFMSAARMAISIL